MLTFWWLLLCDKGLYQSSVLLLSLLMRLKMVKEPLGEADKTEVWGVESDDTSSLRRADVANHNHRGTAIRSNILR